MQETRDGLPLFAFADEADFARWLDANAQAKGVWVKFSKKGATLTKAQAVDCALCHGWIDGQLARLDAEHFLTRFTPRAGRSRWSARNVERAEALAAAGRMTPRGLDEIARAKADGRWAAAYPSASQAQTPPDLAAALAENAQAATAFDALDGANRYAFLYRLHHAKAADRGRRIAEFVAMLARGETFHPPRRSSKP